MKNVFTAFLFACAFVLSFAATSNAEPLKIAFSDWPGFTAFEVAVQKGFFKEAGVDVKFEYMEYGPSIEAFAAGKVDAVTIVVGDAMVTGAGGKPSTGIVLLDYSNGNDMIIGKPGINSIKDLKGKTVAIEYGFVEHLLLLKALEANGMTDADVKIEKIATNDAPQVLASGKVDAVGCWYPVSGQALSKVGGSKPLFTSADAPGLIFDELAVSKESLSSRREDWKKVVAVWFKTVAFINDPATQDEAVKIMAGKVNADPADYKKALKGTALLGLNENLKAFAKSDDLKSVYGSMKIADQFYTKYEVYKEAQKTETYVSPRLINEVSGKKAE